MGYPAKAIANYFLELARKEGKELSPLQIQKLVYIAHGWYLALYGIENPLVDDEYAEAWEYGPVFPSLYHEFKEFGAGSISRFAVETQYVDFLEEKWTTEVPSIKENDLKTQAFLDHIWNLHKGLSGGQLINLTHKENSPWEQTRNESGNIRNADIDNRVIEKYYRDQLRVTE